MSYTRPPTKAAGDTLTAAFLNTYLRDNFGNLSDARTAWTPVLSATSINVTYTLQEGRYILMDKLCIASFHIKLNVVTNAGTGDYSITGLPADPRDVGSSVLSRLGFCEAYDASATTGYQLTPVRSAASTFKLRRDGTAATSAFLGAAVPFIPATTDEFAGQLMFEVT